MLRKTALKADIVDRVLHRRDWRFVGNQLGGASFLSPTPPLPMLGNGHVLQWKSLNRLLCLDYSCRTSGSFCSLHLFAPHHLGLVLVLIYCELSAVSFRSFLRCFTHNKFSLILLSLSDSYLVQVSFLFYSLFYVQNVHTIFSHVESISNENLYEICSGFKHMF